MPKIVFNTKATGAAAEAIKHVANEVITLAENTTTKVVPTVFNLSYKKRTVVDKTEMFGEIVNCFKDKVCRKPFKQINDRIIDYLVKSDKMTVRAISYIIHNLEWNSNIIYIDYENCKEIANTKRYTILALGVVERMGLICKTNKKGVYVINHNEIFYGDINKFTEQYVKLYGNKKAVVTKSGKIDLNKRELIDANEDDDDAKAAD